MDFSAIYHFLFETTAGIGCLIGAFLIISIVLCVVMERRTRKQFKHREKSPDDWSLFDDDDEEEES